MLDSLVNDYLSPLGCTGYIKLIGILDSVKLFNVYNDTASDPRSVTYHESINGEIYLKVLCVGGWSNFLKHTTVDINLSDRYYHKIVFLDNPNKFLLYKY